MNSKSSVVINISSKHSCYGTSKWITYCHTGVMEIDDNVTLNNKAGIQGATVLSNVPLNKSVFTMPG
jgi:hypothetical protein